MKLMNSLEIYKLSKKELTKIIHKLFGSLKFNTYICSEADAVADKSTLIKTHRNNEQTKIFSSSITGSERKRT